MASPGTRDDTDQGQLQFSSSLSEIQLHHTTPINFTPLSATFPYNSNQLSPSPFPINSNQLQSTPIASNDLHDLETSKTCQNVAHSLKKAIPWVCCVITSGVRGAAALVVLFLALLISVL